MSLKLRYASYLLLILASIVGCALVITTLFNGERYVEMVLLCILLYAFTYLAGKRMRKVFFVLSIIRFIKRRNGSVSMEGCKDFIQKMLPVGASSEQKKAFSEEIVELLIDEKVVEIVGESLILLEP